MQVTVHTTIVQSTPKSCVLLLAACDNEQHLTMLSKSTSSEDKQSDYTKERHELNRFAIQFIACYYTM